MSTTPGAPPRAPRPPADEQHEPDPLRVGALMIGVILVMFAVIAIWYVNSSRQVGQSSVASVSWDAVAIPLRCQAGETANVLSVTSGSQRSHGDPVAAITADCASTGAGSAPIGGDRATVFAAYRYSSDGSANLVSVLVPQSDGIRIDQVHETSTGFIGTGHRVGSTQQLRRDFDWTGSGFAPANG